MMLFFAIPSFAVNEFEINFSVLPAFSARVGKDSLPGLLKNHINPKAPNPPSSWSTQEQLARGGEGGTGTRGGGSGVLTRLPKNQIKVEVLDIYRSRNRSQFPLFFEVDPRLEEISSGESPEAGAHYIYLEVLRRVRDRFPHLHSRILKAEQHMPFAKWVRTKTNLPLIHDFIGSVPLSSSQSHVQIAYRRATQVIYNENHYKAMDGLNRAALRLHEYLYAASADSSSVAVQRLLSLIFSKEMNHGDLNENTLKTEYNISLSLVAFTPEAPPKRVLERRPTLSSQIICGILSGLNVLPPSKLQLQIAIDVKFPQLSREHYVVKTTEDLLRFGNKGPKPTSLVTLEISDREELVKILVPFYKAKQYLHSKYPIYLYPFVTTAQDIVCFDKDKKKVVNIDVMLMHNPDFDKEEVQQAKLEAEYFIAQYRLEELTTEIAKEKSPAQKQSKATAYAEVLLKFFEIEGKLSVSKFLIENLDFNRKLTHALTTEPLEALSIQIY